jgi:predicted PurR-regulated permease PerM
LSADYFLIASGSSFRRKMVHIAGPTFSQKKITVQALDEITEQIQRYLLVQVLSALTGLATWLAFLWLGLEQAAVWGIAAAVLNLVPYIGPLVISAASALVGLLQFGTLEMALLVAGASVVIHVISGYLLTPWLTSRTSRLSPVAIFVGVLVWGWLWDIWGLLLGVPILMIVKAVCDRVDGLKPVGELLGT